MSQQFRNTNTGFDIEQPPYEVIRRLNDHIEIRRYRPTKWVATSMKGVVMREFGGPKKTQMFHQIYNYINGTNDDNVKLPMTSPVLSNYTLLSSSCGGGSAGGVEAVANAVLPSQSNSLLNQNCSVSMGFYVPTGNQDNTPQPLDPSMFIQTEPEMIVAAAMFGGFATMDDYIHYRDEIIEALGDEARDYDCVNFMTAGYDPPFKRENRKNEVWLRKIR